MDGPLLLYDGDCGLCHRVVRFVPRYERTPSIRFAALQSPTGRAWAELAGTGMDTILFVEMDTVHARSDAVIGVARHLGIPWRWMAALRVIPRPVRDASYDAIARHRLHWFGRTNCRLPAPGQRDRFLQ